MADDFALLGERQDHRLVRTGGYTVGDGNRITSDGVWTYTYDDAGRRIKKSKGATQETWTYAYDHDGNLTRVEQFATDGGTRLARVDYTADVWGGRISRKQSDGSLSVVSEERYALDQWNPHSGGVRNEVQAIRKPRHVSS